MGSSTKSHRLVCLHHSEILYFLSWHIFFFQRGFSLFLCMLVKHHRTSLKVCWSVVLWLQTTAWCCRPFFGYEETSQVPAAPWRNEDEKTDEKHESETFLICHLLILSQTFLSLWVFVGALMVSWRGRVWVGATLKYKNLHLLRMQIFYIVNKCCT